MANIKSVVFFPGVGISQATYGKPNCLDTTKSEEQFTNTKLLTLKLNAVGLSMKAIVFTPDQFRVCSSLYVLVI
ncbi:hypothetical protein SB763_32950, partial [Burkholderia sp. SIMBA_042]|uniref:hypothetical protein n=1 Tax=Burkholderia sp. SIMBA_042 TaxID=3085783 RepID=UPI00397D9802